MCYNELCVLCAVLFRIIGVSQDLTPAYTGSMTIYVRVSTALYATVSVIVVEIMSRLQSVLSLFFCLEMLVSDVVIYIFIFLLQDAKGNFVRRWIQRQLNFGKIYY